MVARAILSNFFDCRVVLIANTEISRLLCQVVGKKGLKIIENSNIVILKKRKWSRSLMRGGLEVGLNLSNWN